MPLAVVTLPWNEQHVTAEKVNEKYCKFNFIKLHCFYLDFVFSFCLNFASKNR